MHELQLILISVLFYVCIVILKYVWIDQNVTKLCNDADLEPEKEHLDSCPLSGKYFRFENNIRRLLLLRNFDFARW